MADSQDVHGEMADEIDRGAFAAVARLTGGLSPVALTQSFADWAVHLAASPGKRAELLELAACQAACLADQAISAGHPVVDPLPQDHRFRAKEWSSWPWNAISQGFLLYEEWWRAATTGVKGVTRHHEAIVDFAVRQALDTFSPSNFVATNPVLQHRFAETRGKCLVDGARMWLDDLLKLAAGEPIGGEGERVVGRDVAITPGKVIYRNRLIELIQYEPKTSGVRPEPVLIVPAWIMKYYILDLSPENSLIRWLVGQGYTVFAMSWHNPDSDDRDLDMDDYRRLGPMAALDAIEAVTGGTKVHALGYCIGGTLLAIAAAAMARDGDDRLASMTLLAAQTDFSEPGALGLFIDEAQLNLLDSMMWSKGFLDGRQMSGAFQMLRSNDLVWSRMLKTYLMGERDKPSDLMSWNADGTRMPYAMHSEYLRRLFLEDALAEGHFTAGGKAISLSSLHWPIFMVGTETDHVAPWHSVFKLHGLTPAEITFVLTSGGHNTGVVSEPGHPHRHFHMMTRAEDTPALSPEDWQEQATRNEGSWWLEWKNWLDARSGAPVDPPAMGAPEKGLPPLCDAPGQYVFEQ